MKGIYKFGNYGWLGEYRAKSILSVAKKLGLQDVDLDPLVALDIFHSCYLLNLEHSEEPKHIVQLTEPIRRDMELRSITIADDLVSRAFTVKFLLELQKQLQEQMEDGKQGLDQLMRLLDSQGDQGSSQDGQDTGSQTLQKLREAIERAKDEAKEYTENVKYYIGLKAGVGHAVTFGEVLEIRRFAVDVKELLKLFRKIAALDFGNTLKETLFGSFEGVRLGRDVVKTVPSALALPDELFWYKYATSTLPVVETKTSVLEEFLLLIDKSESMLSGNKTLWSRAVALALAMQAKRARLNCKVAFFDDAPFPEKALDAVKDFDKVLKYILTIECEGGTDIDKALKYADEQGARKVVLITDGEDEVKYTPKARLISVMVDGDNDALRRMSERYLKVQPNRDGALKLIKSI